MLNRDREALICDLASEYHIYDIRSLPARLIATFAVGLRDDSRIKQIMRGINYSREEIMLAHIADRLSALMWAQGMYGDADQPPSMVDSMLGLAADREDKALSFSSGAEFLAAWNE
jgi:hypothetical protein